MNCQIIQRRLLGAENPEHQAAEVQAHLDACAPCREWLARLLQLEQTVRQLPAPGSYGRDLFLRQLLKAEVVPANAPPVRGRDGGKVRRPKPVIRRLPAHTPTPVAFPVLRRVVAAGMAAALLLVLLGWWAARGPEQPILLAVRPKADPLVTSLVQHDLKLAKAKEPAERKEALQKIAQELWSEKQSVESAGGAQGLVNDFNDWFQRVTGKFESFVLDQIKRDVPKPAVASTSRVHQLLRNRDLIKALVNGALQLADSLEPLERAKCCKKLAIYLVGEIDGAANQHDGSRAREIGEHFRELLREGVAYNLEAVRSASPSKGFVQVIQDVGGDLVSKASQLEDQLKRTPHHDPDGLPSEFEAAWKAVEVGRSAVEGVLKS
jgi:hypothetical protein